MSKRDGVHEKSDKKWHKNSWCAAKKVMSFTQILLRTFFWNSILPSSFLMMLRQYYSKQQEKHIHEPISVFDITIYLHKNTLIQLLCQYGYIHCYTYTCLRIWFSTSFDIMWYTEAATDTKNLFSHSIVCYFKWITQERWLDKKHRWLKRKMPLGKWHTF